MTHEKIEQWQRAFDAIDDWICMIDLKAEIRQTNSAGERFFGLSMHEMVGQKICGLSHGTDTPQPDCPLPRMLNTGKRESAEIQFMDGRWMLVTVDPVFDDHRRLTNAIHIARDITEDMSTQTQLLKELLKARSQVKTLDSLLPICSICKRIRDAEGEWNQFEAYIHKHAGVDFSHGLCPECARQHYPGYFNNK